MVKGIGKEFVSKKALDRAIQTLEAMKAGEVAFDEDRLGRLLDIIHPPKPWKNSHEPLPKQKIFLSLEHEEVLYGGAAAGGKSDALLMYALEGVHVPGYRCLILRKTFAELDMQGALIPRSKEPAWLGGSTAKWNGSNHTWKFRNGAVIQFGHLNNPDSHILYLSTEWTRICFDELTTFTEKEYVYLQTRLRMPDGFPIRKGIRAASNPGGPGHNWVRKRFISDEAQNALMSGDDTTYFECSAMTDDPVAFVPAKLKDNPFINFEEYSKTLHKLPEITRMRLLNGDWSVKEDSVFKVDNFRYYNQSKDGVRIIPLDKNLNVMPSIIIGDCKIFQTADTAGTSKEREQVKKGTREASYSCVASWAYSERHKYLFLLDVWRDKVDYLPLVDALKERYDYYRPEPLLIEKAHLGPAVLAELKARGCKNVQFVSTYVKRETSDTGKPGKVLRSVQLQLMMEKGRFYIPQFENSWKSDYVDELLGWEGTPLEPADQIDVSSYAARHVDGTTPAVHIDVEIRAEMRMRMMSKPTGPKLF